MASHHHHHQSHPPPTTTTCCCSSYSCCSPPQASPPLPDPLLQALAAHILQSIPPNHHCPHPHPHHQDHDSYPQYFKLNTHNLQPPKSQYKHHRQPQDPHFPQTPEIHSLLSSLLRRIDALESSLHHFSNSHFYHHPPPYSLRDSAARVIQTHFRAFLVRRSRTLRQLKELAHIKSTFNSLKSSLSNETHFDFNAFSRRAMDLLLKLDSIQGGDPMIRDGKRSISRDLVRFLEFIDEVAVKRHGLSLKTMRNVNFGHQNGKKSRVFGTKCGNLGGDQREMIEKLRARVKKISGFSRVSQNDEDDVELEGFHQVSDDDDEENPRFVVSGKNGQIRNGVLVKRNGVQSRVKKNVSFAENGNVYRVFRGDGTCLYESVSSDDQGELVENLCPELEEVNGSSQGTEDDEEVYLENGGSPQTSDMERNPRWVLRSEGNYEVRGHYQDQNGDFLFSAPLPVKMESQKLI